LLPRIDRFVVDTVHGPVQVRALRTIAGRRRLFTVASFGGFAHDARARASRPFPCGPPALDWQLMEPWPWFTTPLTLPVTGQGTARPGSTLSRQLSANTLEAHSRIDPSGQRRRFPSRVRRRLRIVSKRLLSCSHPGSPQTVLVAILEVSFASSSRVPFHLSVPIARVSEIDVPLAKPDCTIPSPCGFIHAQSKTRAADVCCPQSFKERVPILVCATWSHGSTSTPVDRVPPQERSPLWLPLTQACGRSLPRTQLHPARTSDLSSPHQVSMPAFAKSWSLGSA
jgi:hypothetical protein